MRLKERFELVIESWRLLVLCFVAITFIHVFLDETEIEVLQIIGLVLFALSWLALFMAALYQFANGQWLRATLITLLFLVTIPLYMYYSLDLFRSSMP